MRSDCSVIKPRDQGTTERIGQGNSRCQEKGFLIWRLMHVLGKGAGSRRDGHGDRLSQKTPANLREHPPPPSHGSMPAQQKKARFAKGTGRSNENAEAEYKCAKRNMRGGCNKTINLDGTCPHADNGACIGGRAGTPVGRFGRVPGMRCPLTPFSQGSVTSW